MNMGVPVYSFSLLYIHIRFSKPKQRSCCSNLSERMLQSSVKNECTAILKSLFSLNPSPAFIWCKMLLTFRHFLPLIVVNQRSIVFPWFLRKYKNCHVLVIFFKEATVFPKGCERSSSHWTGQQDIISLLCTWNPGVRAPSVTSQFLYLLELIRGSEYQGRISTDLGFVWLVNLLRRWQAFHLWQHLISTAMEAITG